MHSLSVFNFCPKCGSGSFIPSSDISKKCEDCGFEYYKPVSVATVALIFDETGKLLVTRRQKDPCKGKLGLPGGFVDIGETIEEGVVREVKEETNLGVSVERYMFCVPNTYMYSGFDVKTLDFVLSCKMKNVAGMMADKTEIADLSFISIDELNIEDFGFLSMKEIIRKVKKGIY